MRRRTTSLDQAAAVTALDGWVGESIAVRVVTAHDDLLVVSQGELGARTSGKRPAMFWPLGRPHGGREEPGIHLHPNLFESAAIHEGEFVLELRQAGVTLNVRRL